MSYASLQSNPAVSALVADAGNTLPIMAKTTPTNWETMGQTIQAIIEPGTAEPQAEIGHRPQSNVPTPRENTNETAESPTVNPVDHAAERHVERLDSNTVSGSRSNATIPFHPTSFQPADVRSRRSGPDVLADRLFPIRTHDLMPSRSGPIPSSAPIDIPSPQVSSVFLPLPSGLRSSASFPSPPAVQRKSPFSRFMHSVKSVFPTRKPSPIPSIHVTTAPFRSPPPVSILEEPRPSGSSNSILSPVRPRDPTPTWSPTRRFGWVFPREEQKVE
jgi:hypothetical protein